MHTLANSEDPDEIPPNVAFHRGLHCLLSKNDLREKTHNFHLEIITREPLIYAMDHPMLIVSNQKEESISA